jgi:hypothetical protein
METQLAFAHDPTPGETVRLTFSVMAMAPGTNADVHFTLPDEVTLRSGQIDSTGTLNLKQAYQFSVNVSIDKPGSFVIYASAIAGDPQYRFGKREDIDNDGSQIKMSANAPLVPQEGEPVPLGTSLNETITETTHPANWGTPPPIPRSQIKTDPRGNPLDAGSGDPGIQANVTASGHFYYRHDDGTIHGAYGTQVFFWDHDDFSSDDLMAQAVCDGAGFFTATFDNNDPEGGTTDLYCECRTYNGAIDVHSNAGTGNWYTVFLPQTNNIPNGSFDVGGWYIDTGTGGVADGLERAYEVCDYGSSAWAHGNYDLGFGLHYTYIQWYNGSADGTYYVRAEDRIHLQAIDFQSPDVIMHEFGHSFQDSLYGEGDWPPGAGGSHALTGHYTPGLALTEGYATYYSCSAQGDNQFYDDRNPGNLIHFDCDANWDGNGSANGNSDNASNNPNWGYDTESCVIAIMLDMDDSRNDSTDLYDWTTLGDGPTEDVLRNYLPSGHHCYGIQDWFNGWYSRGWGWHPQINGQMHVHGMNQGIARPFLGLSSGVNLYGGTWYYGGYGRGSYDVFNYGSINYNLNQCYVWLRGPAGEDIGQFGGDGNGAAIPARTGRNVFETASQTGYNPAAPNNVVGTYSVTAGHYRSDGNWQLLEPAESGTATTAYVNVIHDTDAPDSCTATDDGVCQNSSSTLHVYATAFDNESSIRGYWTRVGTSQGAGDEQDWVFHAANNQNTFDYTFTGLTMNANTVYYVTIVARNIEGYDTWAYTDGIIAWDATAPGAVTVTDDGVSTANLTQLHVHATSSETDGCIYGYWTRVGTSPGAGDEQDWILHVTGDVDVYDDTLTGLTMTPGVTYYITVVARNMSNLDTWGYSDGIIAGRAIAGRVALGEYIGSYPAPDVLIEIRNVGSGSNLETHVVHLNSTGNYSFYSGVATGSYDIYCKPSHWLKKKRASQAVGAGGATGVNFSCINGDADGDNEVAIGDYAVISAAFNSAPGDGNWNVDADLNGDDGVDIGDYAIMSSHFGLVGDD